MSWRRVMPKVIAGVVVLGITGLLGSRYLVTTIDENKCLHRCVTSLEFIQELEHFRRANGGYPAARDANALKTALREGAPLSESLINDAAVLFESDGSSYRLAVFPNGYQYAGGRCGCLFVADHKIVSAPAILSAESRERLAASLDARLQQESGQ